ncbi:MAG TPA: thiol:disulfide interchange protein DsbA/DsbL [Gammaproteobacteria bacterium]|nr:thiol:disulfide interchange protein DsbA/DsbL [Gammaproteobacteria bacterium]
MKNFKAFTLGLLALGILSIAGAPLAANAATFLEGTNYVPVTPAQPTSVGPGQIEVIEFFWYGCPHCFGVEPYLEAWLKNKPANVVFKRIPAAWPGGEHMDIDAKAFYTAQALGIAEKINEPLFNAIHLQNQLNLTNSQNALQRFFAKYGANKQQFDAAWNSFGVQLKMNQALQTLQRYGVQGVPTFIINGQWMTGAGYQMPYPDIVKCVEFLVQQQEAALKK